MMQNKGYRLIFWGFFLLFFHVNLGSVQLIPSFLAFWILERGILTVLLAEKEAVAVPGSRVRELQETAGIVSDFRRALLCTRAAGFFSLLAFIAEVAESYRAPGAFLSSSAQQIGVLAGGAAAGIFDITIVFFLFRAMVQVSEALGATSLSVKLKKMLEVYPIFYTGGMLVLLFQSITMDSGSGVLSVFAAGLLLFATIWKIRAAAWMRRCYPQCGHGADGALK